MTLLRALYLSATAAAPALLHSAAARAHAGMQAAPERLCERYGRATVARPEGRLIWFNAASVGEVVSTMDLARDLAEAENAALLVTTTTASAAARVAAALPGAIHQYLPADTHAATRRFLDHWRPDLACFVESDLWPRMTGAVVRRGIPFAILNARPSSTRRRIPRTMAELVQDCALVTAQDAATRDEFIGLGRPADSVLLTGDLRADADPPGCDPAELSQLKATIGTRPVWSAVSTHPGDEAEVLRAHDLLLEKAPETLLILVPRHPKRAEALMAAAHGRPLARRSAGETPGPDTQIYLADTLGETGLFFRLAPVVFLGGSFGPEGGHNPFEPLKLGCTVLHGPHVANFASDYAALDLSGAAFEVTDGAALAAAVTALSDPEARAAAHAAADTFTAGRGIRETVRKALSAILAVAGSRPAS